MKFSTRDMYLVRKALAYAIVANDLVPHDSKELSDVADMKALLERLVPIDAQLEMMITKARAYVTGEGLFEEREDY